VRGKRACTVRGGADGKGQTLYLAGGLLHLERGKGCKALPIAITSSHHYDANNSGPRETSHGACCCWRHYPLCDFRLLRLAFQVDHGRRGLAQPRYDQPEPYAALEQAQRQEMLGKLLPAMALPVRQAAELLLGTRRAQIAGHAFVDAVPLRLRV
jgi:hypothetical protein